MSHLHPTAPHRAAATLRMTVASVVAIPFVLLSPGGTAQVAAGWLQVQTSVTPVLDAPVMAFDAYRGFAVLVGRTHATNSLETWEWDGATWAQRCLGVCGVNARGAFTLSYDPICQKVLLFGGYDSPTQTWYNEVWAWNGSSWMLQPTNPGPPGLGYAAMCFDEARAQQVLYGGGTGGIGAVVHNETWTLDLCSTWTSQVQGPHARIAHQLTYDAARQRCVLFGGEIPGGPCSPPNPRPDCFDLFEWNGTSWTSIPASPAPTWRYFHSQAYDRARHRTVVFGGFDGAASFGDTWEWDGTTWTQLSPTAPSPSSREAAAMCYDEVRHYILLYGGSIPTGGWYADTWEYFWPGTCTTFGVGCSGTAGIPTLQCPASGPAIGQPFTLCVQNIPFQPLVLWVIGFSALGSPFSLASIGMPGCSLYIAPDLLLGDDSCITVGIPSGLSVLGASFYMQAAPFDPTANDLGLTMSDAAHLTVGTH